MGGCGYIAGQDSLTGIPMTQFRGTAATLAVVLALSLLSSACTPSPARSAGASGSAFDREANRVRAVVEALIEADNRGDLEKVVGFYTQDAVLTSPTGAQIHGREAVGSHYRDIFERHRLALRVQILETSVMRDTATVRGRTTGHRRPVEGGEAVQIDDDFVAGLVLETDGRWRIARLSWTPHG
jgi:uncharacterized protein (TIGR02246 family)